MILKPTTKNIKHCADQIHNGNLVIFPTETVYGLGGAADNESAVKKIFAFKGRPSYNPLICHIARPDMLDVYGYVPKKFLPFVDAYWSGSVTFVLLLKSDKIAPQVVAYGETVALRVPSHPVAQSLLSYLNRPIAAPSANKSTQVSPTCAADSDQVFKDLPTLDGGQCVLGLESSVVDLTQHTPFVLRPGHQFPIKGALSVSIKKQHNSTHKPQASQAPKNTLRSPGLLTKHYAPQRPVYLDVEKPAKGGAYLSFGPKNVQTDLEKGFFNLSPEGNIQIAARNLYKGLRLLDRAPFLAIHVCSLPKESVGHAIYDRLNRAKAG